MPIPYFAKFPVIGYDVDGDRKLTFITDITKRARLREKVRNNIFIYYDYEVKDGETPDIIAAKYYGTPQFHWLVLFSNDIIDPYFEWPMSYNVFLNYIQRTYGSVFLAKTKVRHFETVPGGLVIDQATFDSLPASERKIVFAFDHEVDLNESKRSIKLLDRQFAGIVDTELDNLLKQP